MEVQTLNEHDLNVLRYLAGELSKGVCCGSATDKSVKKLRLLGFVTGKSYPYATQEGRDYLNELQRDSL